MEGRGNNNNKRSGANTYSSTFSGREKKEVEANDARVAMATSSGEERISKKQKRGAAEDIDGDDGEINDDCLSVVMKKPELAARFLQHCRGQISAECQTELATLARAFVQGGGVANTSATGNCYTESKKGGYTPGGVNDFLSRKKLASDDRRFVAQKEQEKRDKREQTKALYHRVVGHGDEEHSDDKSSSSTVSRKREKKDRKRCKKKKKKKSSRTNSRHYHDEPESRRSHRQRAHRRRPRSRSRSRSNDLHDLDNDSSSSYEAYRGAGVDYDSSSSYEAYRRHRRRSRSRSRSRSFHSGTISGVHDGSWRFDQLPVGCRVEILNFLDPGDLDSMSFVSKSLREDCFRNGITKKIVPVYEIRMPHPGRGLYGEQWRKTQAQTTVSLLHKICRNQVARRDKFSRYPLLKVCRVDLCKKPKRYKTSIRPIQNIRIHGVLFLDVSLEETKDVPAWFIKVLLELLPNLQEIKLSNIDMYGQDINYILFRKHPLLEKFTAIRSRNFWLHGGQFSGCHKLKELILDGSELKFFDTDGDYLDLTGHDDTFIFRDCKFLERLSIRNAFICHPRDTLPQKALIKFVRKAPPSLRWFRSDLTPENIRMLRIERPEVLCC